MKRLLLSLTALALGVSLACVDPVYISSAYAQSPVYTKPFGANSVNSSGTIAVTNTFQSIWAASVATTGRSDCIIQNNGAASMFLYFGPIASATTATSLTLVAGAIFRCGNNGVIIKDQISITGTATQAFFAIQF